MNLRNNMNPICSELKARYREYFESKLAVALSKNPDILPAVKKISNIICSYISEHKDAVLKQITNNPLIAEELYHPHYYGRLLVKNKQKPEDILNDVLSILKSNTADLNQTMQIHAIFAFRLIPQIMNLQDMKQNVINYSHERIRITKDDKLSKHLGICRNKVFNKMIGESAAEHSYALDRYAPDAKSNFFKQISAHNIAFVAGPSGHTKKLMSGALSLGITDKEELMQYALACFAFLTSGGNHSFHEVMTMANQVAGVPFEFDNYPVSFSDSFKKSTSYDEFCKQFPEYMLSTESKKLAPK